MTCLPYWALSQSLLFEDALYRLAITGDQYELNRLDDPMLDGANRGKINWLGDTAVLMDRRADSIIRAEFVINELNAELIYLSPNLQWDFRNIASILPKTRLLDENGRMLESWQSSSKDPNLIWHFTYDEYLDTKSIHRYKDGVKDGEALEQGIDEVGPYLEKGEYKNGERNGVWLHYRRESDLIWRRVLKVKYKEGEIVKTKFYKKKKKADPSIQPKQRFDS